MWKRIFKATLVLTTSSVVIPYSIVFLLHLLYGKKNLQNIKQIFSPHHVYKINSVLIQRIKNYLNVLSVVARGKIYYSTTNDPKILQKNILYGKNLQTFDLYFPITKQPACTNYPFVIFVYGGAWGSGDKSLYTLLGRQLSDVLNAIVIIPNISSYPSGYVDDMIQDVVDCLSWVHKHGKNLHGNTDRVLLIGHSSGAHLVSSAVLQLVSHMLQSTPGVLRSGSPFNDILPTSEGHFNGAGSQSQPAEDPKQNESFYLVTDKRDASVDDLSTESVDQEACAPLSGNIAEPLVSDSFIIVDEDERQSSVGQEKVLSCITHERDSETIQNPSNALETELRVPNNQRLNTESLEPELNVSINKKLKTQVSSSELKVMNMLASVKSVIGLAGVYDIGDHFAHETERGIENLSTMLPAMYSIDCFNRFSPTHIVKNLPSDIRIPRFELLHGEKDVTVPYSSSVKYAEYLSRSGSEVELTIIPECGHYPILFDLMQSSRPFYELLMGKLLQIMDKTAA